MSLDDESLIWKMVFVLRNHPNEWFSFGKLRRLIAIPGGDENVIAAISGYRDDLFAVHQDRRVKLRESIVGQLARQDLANWKVPKRMVPDERRELRDRVACAIGGAEGTCYCDVPVPKILSEIIGETVPDEALILACCWITICRVRGLYMQLVSSDAWSELCRRRVDVKHRENPNDL
jgi:hypothetical protein